MIYVRYYTVKFKILTSVLNISAYAATGGGDGGGGGGGWCCRG